MKNSYNGYFHDNFIHVSSADIFFFGLSFLFLIFSVLFYSLHRQQLNIRKEIKDNQHKISTNHLAAKRLSSIIKEEKLAAT